MEILAKLGDSLLMFWQALDDRERRMLVVGVAWLVLAVAGARAAQLERERQAEEIAEAVARRLTRG